MNKIDLATYPLPRCYRATSINIPIETAEMETLTRRKERCGDTEVE